MTRWVLAALLVVSLGVAVSGLSFSILGDWCPSSSSSLDHLKSFS